VRKKVLVTTPVSSVQLYSLAKEFSADMAGSLDKLAAIGLTRVEAFDFVGRAPELRRALDASGLSAPTGHAPLLSDTLWTPDGEIPTPAPEVVFEAAATAGIHTVIDPFVPAERWATREGVDDITARLNAASEVAKTFGLEVGYHNHAQEFVATIDGRTAYEYAISQLDASVKLELDLFWALVGDQDVVELTRSLGERLLAVHVKDGIKLPNPWAPSGGEFASTALDQRHAGTAEVPLADALRANDSIELAIIEYDNAPGDVFADIAASHAFLIEQGLAR